MTDIIAVASLEGDIGATTTCADLGTRLTKEGARTMQPDLRRLSKQQNSQVIKNQGGDAICQPKRESQN